MRSPSLTRKSNHQNGYLVSEYHWRGNTISVRDSARTAILISELLQDETPQIAKIRDQLLVTMLFPKADDVVRLANDRESIADLIYTVLWDAFGIDATPERIHAAEYEDPIMDWNEDAARIRASLLQCYGIDWDERASLISYADMCALIGTLMETDQSTPMQQAIYYRTAKPPRQTKYNLEERQTFEARAKHYALSHPDDIKTQNDASADMFAAMKRAAGGTSRG